MSDRLEAIVIGPEAKAPLVEVEEARAVAGRGLEGDRYFEGRGSFDRLKRTVLSASGRHVTLIDHEAIATCNERLAATGDLDEDRRLEAVDLRRNLVTRGLDLPALVRRRFRVGDALLVGVRLCPPCKVLRRLTGTDVLTGLRGIGGLRADILESGTIRTGDPIRIVED